MIISSVSCPKSDIVLVTSMIRPLTRVTGRVATWERCKDKMGGHWVTQRKKWKEREGRLMERRIFSPPIS